MNGRRINIQTQKPRLSLTIWMIIITSLVSLIVLIFGSEIIPFVALQPLNLSQVNYVWTILTHMFVHAGVFHLFVNMFSLFFLGRICETIIGRRRFLWFFLVAGLFAGLFTAGLSLAFGGSEVGAKVIGSPEAFMVGASGAIFGLLGLLAVLIPRTKVSLIAGPLIVIILQFILQRAFPEAAGVINVISTILIFGMLFFMFSPIRGMRALAMPITIDLWFAPILAIVPLVVLSFFVELPIGNVAHFGGLIVGLVYGAHLRSKYRKKVARLQTIFR